MPWHLDDNKAGCSGVAVVKDSDGSVAGCHPTQAAAKAQLAALYANDTNTAASMTAPAQPLDPTPGMPDPQALESEFATPAGPDWVPDFADGTMCWGVALAEGIPDGSMPRRMFTPGVVTFAPTPFSILWQPETEDGHDESVVVGRVDYIWRDGSLVRWIGCMDSAGAYGAEAERLVGGGFLHGCSPMTDDIDSDDVELIFHPGMGPGMQMPMGEAEGEYAMGCDPACAASEFCMSPKHPGPCPGTKRGASKPSIKRGPGDRHGGYDKASGRYVKPSGQGLMPKGWKPSAADGTELATTAGAFEAELEAPEMPEPEMLVYHAGRIRSLTLLPEQAFVEACIYLGTSPYPPTPEAIAGRRVPGEPAAATPEAEPDLALQTVDEVAMTEPIVETITAAAYTLTIPDLWPERWFQEPSPEEMAQVASGAIQITPEGRVWGLLAPAGVEHRGFRGSGRMAPQVPRGIDYSEWQNKGCIVAGADGNAYKINAGTVTFDCGHASPTDPRRADPSFASQHYDNSCSVAMRARCGENRYGTWFAGGLVKGLTASAFQQIMGCALSGDWQGGKLKAALLVPVEGFPQAVTASVRERMGTLVASSVPIVFDAPEPPPALATYEQWREFDMVASARFDELAEERFNQFAAERFSEIAAELGRG